MTFWSEPCNITIVQMIWVPRVLMAWVAIWCKVTFSELGDACSMLVTECRLAGWAVAHSGNQGPSRAAVPATQDPHLLSAHKL